MIETFVLTELARQLSGEATAQEIMNYRRAAALEAPRRAAE